MIRLVTILVAVFALLSQTAHSSSLRRYSRSSRGSSGEKKYAYCELHEPRKGMSKAVDKDYRIKGSLVMVSQSKHIKRGKGPLKVRLW